MKKSSIILIVVVALLTVRSITGYKGLVSMY